MRRRSDILHKCWAMELLIMVILWKFYVSYAVRRDDEEEDYEHHYNDIKMNDGTILVHPKSSRWKQSPRL